MTPRIVDASLVAAAFFQETGTEAARAILAGGGELQAPDIILAEVGNVIWKRYGRGEIDEAEAGSLLSDFLRLPLVLVASGELIASALELAMRTKRTVYDSLYLALALRTRSVLVTSDLRLVNALAGGPLEKHVAWIGKER
jgi:predicted nucleic acid-binding protein